MRNRGSTSLKKAGFTLLEVMLVLLLMGLAAGYVMFNAFGASKSDLLKTQAQRLQVIVDMASDFAVLNQEVEKGVKAADEGRLTDHTDVKTKWEAKRAAQMD